MMTQTHILLAAAIYARPRAPMRTFTAIAGGLFPDLALTILFVVARLSGVSAEKIFGQLFWSERWSAIMAPGNSFVVFTVLILLGIWVSKLGGRAKAVGTLIIIFCVSALLHLVTDFFLHADDARVQFWPISDWVFHSPVSYWDVRYYGAWVQPLEILFAIGCISLLIMRFKGKFVRGVLGGVLLLYLLMPIYFYLNHAQM